jgi:hypothetical protein
MATTRMEKQNMLPESSDSDFRLAFDYACTSVGFKIEKDTVESVIDGVLIISHREDGAIRVVAPDGAIVAWQRLR